MDDQDNSNLNLVDYLSPSFDSIGVACNCHPSFEQFCVIELAGNLVPHSDNRSHIHTIVPDLYSFYIDPFVHVHAPVVPQLFLRADPRCDDTRKDGFCEEVVEYEYEEYFDPLLNAPDMATTD